MEIVRCSKGHFYDSEENATCPMCAAEAARSKNPIGNNILGDDILPTDYFGRTGDSHAVDNTPYQPCLLTRTAARCRATSPP